MLEEQKKDNCFYHLNKNSLMFYMPFPSLDELNKYKITHFSNGKKITSVGIEKFQKSLIKDLGPPKLQKSNQLALESSLYEAEEGIYEMLELNLTAGILFGGTVPDSSKKSIEKYIKNTYPNSLNEFTTEEFNYLDDSTWTINPITVKNYDYLLIKFELGFAAKTIFTHTNYIRYLYDHSFWECFIEAFEHDDFYEEFYCNGIDLYDLRKIKIEDIFLWEGGV